MSLLCQTSQIVPEASVEPVEEKADAVQAINTVFSQHEPTEEEKAYEGTDFTLPQLDPEDSASKLDEFALGPISEEMLSPMRDWLGWQVVRKLFRWI